MMTMQATLPVLSIGGLGCQSCKHWSKYIDKETKELLNLVGDWGMCNANKTPEVLQELETSAVSKPLKVRKKDYIITKVFSTSHDFRCKNFESEKKQ